VGFFPLHVHREDLYCHRRFVFEADCRVTRAQHERLRSLASCPRRVRAVLNRYRPDPLVPGSSRMRHEE
jgi:hypothetical protein